MKAKKAYTLKGNRVFWRGCLIGEVKRLANGKWEANLDGSYLTAFLDVKNAACEWLVTQFVNSLVSQVNMVLDLKSNSNYEK